MISPRLPVPQHGREVYHPRRTKLCTHCSFAAVNLSEKTLRLLPLARADVQENGTIDC